MDLGWTWRSEGIKLGFFAGYHYYFERVNAFGCVQTASPVICVPPVPASELLITQETNWNAVRLGFNGEWRWGGWILNTDLAWIPYAWLNANDTHWQRIHLTSAGPRLSLATVLIMCKSRRCYVINFRMDFRSASAADIGGSIPHLRKRTSSPRLLGAEFHRPSHS